MSDRYRYPRARSPPLFNPGRASLPNNISGYTPVVHEHLHIIPARREVIQSPLSSASSVSSGGTITTTYKVRTDAPGRGSSVREGSRTRRSTIDNHSRPTVVTTTTRHRPVIHGSAVVRPESPLKNNYRLSEEDYVAIPATSRHGGHHHSKRYSATMDNADMNRLAREREAGRLHVVPVRESSSYTNARANPIYTGVITRHADTVSDDYGDDGYGYTNPGDLVQYDLSHNQPTHQRPRSDSFDAGRSRPTSITGYGDIVPRSYEARERGPPPTTRGFDKIRGPVYEQPQGRVPRTSSPISMAPMEPVHRPAAFEPVQRPAAFDPAEPIRRSSSLRARPSSVYNENRDPRREPRDDYYEVRDEEKREGRPHRHENPVEQRGFGIRTERLERPESRARVDRPERVERVERSDRMSRNDGRPDGDRAEQKEHKGRDAIATGLSLAASALGVGALKNVARDDRDDREERKRREHEEEPRRRRDKEERGQVDAGGREPKERRHRDDEFPASRDMAPPPREVPPPPRDAPARDITPPQASVKARDLRERKSSRDVREKEPERRERSRHISEAALNGSAIDSRSDSSASDEFRPRSRREPPARRESGTALAAFNPKDTMDLFALKEALKSKDKDPGALPPKDAALKARTPRGSTTKGVQEAAEIRNDLQERWPREPPAPSETRQMRVVSPPREKAEDKPVKGILRQPKDRFPEDPAPIREGVAPLKDAKKDGIPPDARWTKISRKLVNPEALEAGKERFEAREDFVIVLRVLSRDEVQGYAEVTQRIRSSREDLEDQEAADRRRARRERHERHKRERNGEIPRGDRGERRPRHRGEERERRVGSDSGSDSTEDDEVYERPQMLEAPQRRANFQDALMSGGLGELAHAGWDRERERVNAPVGAGGGSGRK
ncbi:unnamed protein product [Diplocarpon coronariae]